MLRRTMLVTALVGGAASAQPQLHTSYPWLKYQQQARISDPFDDQAFARQSARPSRFDIPVCPSALGLAEGQGALVVERMRRVASAVGVPLAEPGCKPNVLVMVAADKRTFLDQQWRDHPYLFPQDWNAARVHELERDPAPTAAWTIDELRSADGGPLDYSSEVAVNRTTRTPSRITPGARRYLTAAALVIQADALRGLTTTQIADYAAMRTFVRTDLSSAQGATSGTILGLLDTPIGQPAPVTLTERDLALLKSVYGRNPNSKPR